MDNEGSGFRGNRSSNDRGGGFRRNSGSGGRGGGFRGNRSSGGFRDDQGPKEMHKAVCADCGNECEVPFKPKEGRPVYCRECFSRHKKY